MVSSLSNLVREIGVSLPLLVVYVVGLGIALTQMKRAPRAASAAAGAFGVLLAATCLRWLVHLVMVPALAEMGPQAVSLGFAVVGFVFSLVEAAALAGLLYAVFADRPAAAPSPANAAFPPKPAM